MFGSEILSRSKKRLPGIRLSLISCLGSRPALSGLVHFVLEEYEASTYQRSGNRTGLPLFGMYHEASSTLMSAISSLWHTETSCELTSSLATDVMFEEAEKLLGGQVMILAGERP